MPSVDDRRDVPDLLGVPDPPGGLDVPGVADGRGDDVLAVLVLGESTAAGVGARTQAEGLAPAIAAGVAEHSRGPVSWRVTARTGSTARRALSRLVPQLLDETFDVVVVALGVNDVLGLRPARAWQRDVEALTAALQKHLRPGGVIILAGLPDLAGFPSLPQPMRTVLALHARHLDRRLARAAADHPSTVHTGAPPIETPDVYAEDGFHPSAVGYRLWAAHLVQVANPYLRARR